MIGKLLTLKPLAASVAVTATIGFSGLSAQAENVTLKISFVGVTSGSAATWGVSNARSMKARAAWLDEIGGEKIATRPKKIEIVTFNDGENPIWANAGSVNFINPIMAHDQGSWHDEMTLRIAGLNRLPSLSLDTVSVFTQKT
ncbi:hypothetical protein AB8880_00570 [Alphaproteobacteria bacterium LSUCC0684]